MLSPSIFTSIINSYLPEPHASLLNGILFGINLKTTKLFYEQLKMVGLLHIVVLSGINITLLGAIITRLTASFSKLMSCLLTILIIIVFILFVGLKAPIIRAGFMGILTLVAILTGRKNFTLYALFLSAVFTFMFWPRWLTTVSFQLSYAATLGIILFSQTKPIYLENWLARLLFWLWQEIRLSLSAQIFTAPIIFFYFKQISLISPFSNILIAPLIAPLMIFGFLTAILGKIHFLLGFFPSFICWGLLSYMVFVIELLAKIPFSFLKF